MKKRLIALSVLAVLLFGGIFQATADTFPPTELFEIWSPDGSRVFRFVPSEEHRGMADAAVYLVGEAQERLHAVTGLPSLAYERDFVFSDDLRHFAFFPVAEQIIALKFFADGNLIKTHDIYDLVYDRSAVWYSDSMAFWRDWRYDIRFSPQDNTVSLRTIDGIHYTFDITTGEIQSSTRQTVAFVIAGIGVAAVLAYMATHRKRSRKKDAESA